MNSVLHWILDRAAWQGLNSTQSSKRMRGSGCGRPTRPESPFVVLLWPEREQRAVIGR